MAGSKRAINKPARPGLGLLGALAVLACLLLPGSALAASAGLKPSEAPLVEVGQHYFGNVGHASNEGGGFTADFWHLPPLMTGDAVTIAWHAKGSNGGEAPWICLVQNVDDYSWAESQNTCNGSQGYDVASNDSARTVIEAKSATSFGYLEFNGAGDGSQPYDFVIESIQHAIGVELTSVTSITATSTLTGSADLSSGSPVPDGTVFNLVAKWHSGGELLHTATSAATAGGSLSFPLALPAETAGKKVRLAITRPADPSYLATKSSPLIVTVAAPPTPEHHRRHHHRRKHRRHHHRHHHRR